MALTSGNLTPTTEQNEWLLSSRNNCDEEAIDLLGKINSTGLGSIKGGTIIGKITGGKWRPCGNGEVSGAQASASILLNNGEAQNFYAGDDVAVISTLGVRGTGQLTDITAANDDIDVASAIIDGLAHVIQLVDPGAQRATTDLTSLTWAGTPGESVGTFVFTLSNSATPAINATVNDLINAINRDAGHWLRATLGSGSTGTNVIDTAVPTATLTGGTAVGGTLDASNIVLSVNKTTHTLTLTDSVTVADGDQIRLSNGAQTPVGVLERTKNTFELGYVDKDGVAQHNDVRGNILHGNVRADSTKLQGYSATFMKSTLNDLGIRVQ